MNAGFTSFDTAQQGAHVTPQDELARRLDTFIASQGVTRDKLLEGMREALGAPLLAVASGSVVHGAGNRRSDVDIIVVIENAISRVPILCCASTVLIDARYFAASTIRDWPASFRSSTWPQPHRLTQQEWAHRQRQLVNCARLGEGLLLQAREGWDQWLGEFHEPWLVRHVTDWWKTEAARWLLAGQWLSDRKPMLAMHCYLDAALSALEARAAAGGRIFFGRKWLAEKFRALGDREALDALRAILRVPTHEREAKDFISRCEAVRSQFDGAAPHGLAAQLWYRPDVRILELHGRTLISRSNLRGLEFKGEGPARPQPDGPLWQGALGTSPPSDVLALFAGDLTWLSIVATT